MPPSNEAILRASERECRRLARSHYENFLVASILLPRPIRQPFYNIYAFCRTADDAADESPSHQIALSRLVDLQSGIDAVYQNEPPPHGCFPALHHTVRRFGLSRKPFDNLLSAFRQDQRIHQYETMDQLVDYCERSANPVGRMVLQLGDALDDANAQLSDEICTGLQLANFWQDVARDRAIGRIYLPADQRDAFGVKAEMLDADTTATPMRRLLADLCDQTESRLRRGLPLADRVPKWLASDIKLFAHGGLATVQAIRDIDYDVLRIRPKVSKWRQLKLVGRAVFGSL